MALLKLWRESSTLIILGRNANNVFINGSNYKVLVLMRSANANFLPNLIVFPGGNIEKSDSERNWLSVYKSLGISDHHFKELATVQDRRPFIYDRLNSIHMGACNDDIERDISLRIAAVRETFEELGLMICKSKEQLHEVTTGQTPFSSTVQNLDVKYWQKEVHNDANKFQQLCQKHQVVPDLWNIYEWSNWLQPKFLGLKRFDTSFYLVALPDQPNVFLENNEVQHHLWMSPKELLELNDRKELKILPPQQYELSRLEKINDIETIIKFAKDRNKLGTTLLFPIFYRMKDAFVSILPGDDSYPVNPDYTGVDHNMELYAEKTLAELRNMSKNVHRMEGEVTGNAVQIFSNVVSPNGHINPVRIDVSPIKFKL